MVNKKAKAVIKRLMEESRTYNIKVLGDEQNQVDAFSILMHGKDGFGSTKKKEYWGLTKTTIDLLNEAEIKFKVLE